MDTLILSATRALRSIFAPGMFGIMALCVLATIGALFMFAVCAALGFSWLGAHMHHGWITWLGSAGASVLAWFLFPGIMPIIVSFFDERIARTIEAQDYPAAAPGKSPEFFPELFHDARFAVTAILLNILVLPLYLLPVINIFLFYFLNGYLLGHEFFVMAAKRHMPVQDAENLRKKHSRIVFAAGILLTLLATVPIINLFAPFWGIALMVHLYHRLTPSNPAANPFAVN